jgi:hypothetical protein
MKRKDSLTLDIPHPCTQSWNEMSPVDGGRHCLHCQKTVIDFTSMTDQEILTLLSKQKNNLCGKFREEQLSRTLIADTQPRHAFLPAAMLASLLAAIIPANSKADDPGAAMTQIMIAAADNVAKENAPRLLKGQIVDSLTNEALEGVTISLKGSGTVGTVSDEAGKFQIAIPVGSTAQSLIFRISYLGYNTKEVSFNTKELSAPITISLQQSATDLKELVVTSYATRKVKTYQVGAVAIVRGDTLVKTRDRLTWWQKITHLFKKKEKSTQ